MSTEPSVRVLVTEASAMACELLAENLRRTGFNVVGCAVKIDELIEKVTSTHPDVLLANANLQDKRLGGFKALRELRKQGISTRAVMLLEQPDTELTIAAFRVGAKGVFFCDEHFSVLCRCIRAVNRGQIWVRSNDLELILEAFAHGTPLREVAAQPVAKLSRREEQIVALVAQGLTNRELAHKLFLSEHTVKNYLFRIFDKLEVSNRVELAMFATSGKREPDSD